MLPSAACHQAIIESSLLGWAIYTHLYYIGQTITMLITCIS